MKKIFKIGSLLLGLSLVGGGIVLNAEKCINEVSAKNVTSSLVFTKACGGSGTADDGVTWTVESDQSESSIDATKGIHYGTGSAAVSYLKLTSAEFAKTISKVAVNASGASKTSATISCTVSGADFGTQDQALTSSNTEYTFEGSTTGVVVVSLNQSSATKALYLKSIVVTYDDGETVVNVDGVTLSKETLSLGIGETSQLTATVSPNDASDKSVTWSSSDESVTKIDKNGVIEGIKPGTSTIKVVTTDGEYEDECVVTVADDGINRDKLTSANFKATNTSYVAFDSVSSVSKAVYEGSTNKQTDGAFAIKTSTFGLYTTETGGLIKSISVEMGVNSAATAKYVVYGTNTPIKDDEDLAALKDSIIASTNESKTVALDKDYQFFAIKSSSGAPQIASVKVKWQPVKPTSITAEDTMTLTIDATKELEYTLVNEELIVTETDVEFSSDSAAVTVTNDGVVTAVSEGTANITIKSKADTTVTKTIAVTVSATKTPVTSVTLDQTELVIKETHTEELVATVLPEEASIKTVTWSSSDETVATVDKDGKVAGVKAGTATIKVESTDDATKYAECAVTVEEREIVQFAEAETTTALIEGGKYIIVGEKDGVSHVMAHFVSGNNVKSSDAELNTENTIAVAIKEDIEDCFYTLVANDDGTWSFFDGEKYLCAAGTGTNNYMKTTTAIDGKAKFAITFDNSGLVSVVAQDDTVNGNLRFNKGNVLFSCYGVDEDGNAKQDQIYLYGVVENQNTANALAQNFMIQTNIVCSGDADLDRSQALASMWPAFKETYQGLFVTEQAKFLETNPDALIEAMLERYDYLVNKYSLENFITGHVVSPVNANFKPLITNNNNTAVTIIAIVSVASVGCLIALIAIKRRKSMITK